MVEKNPIAFAKSKKQELQALAPEIEKARGVPKEVAQDLAVGGLFQLFTPRWLGGLELDPCPAFQALEETAKGDMSCAWAAMISSTSALGAAWVEKTAAQEIFSNPATLFAGVAAPQGKAEKQGDTYKVAGTWQWGSGSNNADYFMGGCFVQDGDNPPQQRMVIFPKNKITLMDDWFVMGLNGSSSGSVSVAPCEIPATHSFSLAGKELNSPAPLYQMPFFSVLAGGIAACALGNVGGMLDDFLTLAEEKTPSGSRSALSQKPYVQIGIAKIAANLNEARGQFYYTMEEAWQKVQGERLNNKDKAKMRLAAITATTRAAEIATTLHQLAGGSAVFSSSPLQRRLRDSLIATQHRMVGPTNYQIIGQILLGVADKKAVLMAAL